MSSGVGAVGNADIAFLLAFATLLVIPIAVILFGVAVVQVCQMLTREQLVIADMVDATGLGWKDQIHGLGQSVREGFCQAADDYRARGDRALGLIRWFTPQRTMPTPEETETRGLATLADGLKSSAPTPLSALLFALAALVPSHGTKVETFLAQDPGSSPRLRFEARIADLADGSGAVLESVVGRPPEPPGTVSSQASDFAAEAGRWLEIQLLRRQLVPPGSPTEPDGPKHDVRANKHVRIGGELLRLAGFAKVLDREVLLLEAIDEFKQAVTWQPDSYVAVESLANTMSYLGVAQSSRSLDRDAVKQYELALRLAGADSSVKEADPNAETRIWLANGIARLRTGDKGQRASAEEDFEDIHPARTFYSDRGFDVLYTAACWQATHAGLLTADGLAPDADIEGAAEYMALALARNPDVAAWTRLDPDFDDIRSIARSLADAANWMALSQSEKNLLQLEWDLPHSGVVPPEVEDVLRQLEMDLLQAGVVPPDVEDGLLKAVSDRLRFELDVLQPGRAPLEGPGRFQLAEDRQYLNKDLAEVELDLVRSGIMPPRRIEDSVQLIRDLLNPGLAPPRPAEDLLQFEQDLLQFYQDVLGSGMVPATRPGDLSKFKADLDKLTKGLDPADRIPLKEAQDLLPLAPDLLKHVQEIKKFARQVASDWSKNRSATAAK